MILIFSRERDTFINKVIDAIGSQEFIRISKNNDSEIKFLDLDSQKTSIEIKNDYTLKESDRNITSILYNASIPKPTLNQSSQLSELVSSQLTSIASAIPFIISKVSIGNETNMHKADKIKNLAVANNVGFKIPKTIIATQKTDVLDFFLQQNTTEIICKRICEDDLFFEDDNVFDISKTFLINQDNLENIPISFGHTLFQEKIEKEYEIRVIYIEGNMYCSAIFDSSKELDYRKNFHSKIRPIIVPFVLKDEDSEKVKKLMATLGYTYGSIDLIHSKNGENIFLEINPIGQIDFINEECNYYLEEHFAKILTSK